MERIELRLTAEMEEIISSREISIPSFGEIMAFIFPKASLSISKALSSEVGLHAPSSPSSGFGLVFIPFPTYCPFKSLLNSSSPMILTPSPSAFCSFEPGSRPARR